MYDINYFAVAVAAVASMAVAVVWYSPSVFGTLWMRAVGVSEEEAKRAEEAGMRGMWRQFFVSFCVTIFSLYVVARLLIMAEEAGIKHPLLVSVWSAALVGAVVSSSVIWEKRSLPHFLVNMGYTGVSLVGGGAIIYYWPW